MRIGICDDTEKDREKIHNWLRIKHPNITESCIFEFCSGEAVIEFLNYNQLDLLFLDCRMCGINCIECAVRIRKKDKKIKIIATTDFEKYAPYGYEAEIYRFILKKDFEQKIDRVFDKLLHEYKLFDDKIFCVKTDKGLARLLISDIVYIESILRKKIITYLDGETYTVYSNMKELANFLEPVGFVQPHSSYLINSVFVSKFSNENIALKTGEAIPISRKYAKTAYDKLMNLFT